MTHLPTAHSQDVCDPFQQLDTLFDKVDEGLPIKECLQHDFKMEEPRRTRVASRMDAAYAITEMRNQVLERMTSLESQQEQMSQHLDSMDQRLECLNQHLESLCRIQNSMNQDLISTKGKVETMSNALRFLATAISENHRQSLSRLDDEDSEKQPDITKERPAVQHTLFVHTDETGVSDSSLSFSRPTNNSTQEEQEKRPRMEYDEKMMKNLKQMRRNDLHRQESRMMQQSVCPRGLELAFEHDL